MNPGAVRELRPTFGPRAASRQPHTPSCTRPPEPPRAAGYRRRRGAVSRREPRQRAPKRPMGVRTDKQDSRSSCTDPSIKIQGVRPTLEVGDVFAYARCFELAYGQYDGRTLGPLPKRPATPLPEAP